MRQNNYIFIAMGCGLCAVPVACGSNNGVEGGGAGTGGSGYSQAGSSATGGSPYVGNTSTGSTNSAGGTDANSTSTGCAQQNVSIQALPPDIMIVLDRSLSMTDKPDGTVCAGGSLSGDGKCGTDSKWYQTRIAVETVVQNTQAAVNWGLWWLGDESTTCGASTTAAVPIIPIGQDSYTPIQAALDGNTFTGAPGTPTAAVVKNAHAYMSTLTDPNPKFLLLATDGEPNCANGNVGSTDTTGATNAITNAHTAGIPTFVVGIATTTVATATTLLNSAAQAGCYPQTGAATQYYAVTDTASLQDTLSRIVGIATSCTIPLQNVPTDQDWNVAISATDSTGTHVEVPNSATDGWAYTDASKSSITLVGTYCDGMKSGAYTDFNFIYSCSSHIVVT